MTDIVEELHCLYVWPQSVADNHADILTPRQIKMLYEVGNVAERAEAEITKLRAEVEALRGAAALERQIGRIQLAHEWSEWLAKPCEDCTGDAPRQAAFNEAAMLVSTTARAAASKEFGKLPIEAQFDEQIIAALKGGDQ